jgi:UDP-glucose 4-epimerase
MKFLLIGSNGFIGSQVANLLESNHNDVVRIDSNFAAGRGFFDYNAMDELFRTHRFDCVITTAWKTDSKTYRNSLKNINYAEATLNLFKQSVQYEIPKFVALGSAAEYGATNFNCQADTSELVETDQYSSSKISTFQSINSLLEFFDTSFVWLRVFQPYGKNQDASRFLPYLISNIESGMQPVIKHPRFVSDWTHTTDIALAIIYAIENDFEGAVDVGTGVGTSNLDLYRLLTKTYGIEFCSIGDFLDSKVQGLVMSKDAKLLKTGWRPQIDLPTGLANLIGHRR